jgi:hypothetical protein
MNDAVQGALLQLLALEQSNILQVYRIVSTTRPMARRAMRRRIASA